MAPRVPKSIDGWNSRTPPLEVLAEFESHEGDRIRVEAGWEKREFFRFITNPKNEYFLEDVLAHQPYFSTKVYVNRQLTAEYSSADLPDDWLLFVGIELQQLARERAGAEEVISTIDYIIPRLSEKHDQVREAAELCERNSRSAEELETMYDFWDYFVPLQLDKTEK